MKIVRFMQRSILSVEGKMYKRITFNNRNGVSRDMNIRPT